MCRMQIKDGIVIDAMENVAAEIESLNGMKIDDYEVIRKFIQEEFATVYYIDEKLNSFMEPTSAAKYVWLDTGFLDRNGAPILVSLHRGYEGFEGHITGTSRKLINSMKERHSKNKRHINDNASRFLNKYNSKVDSRRVHHITDIEKYYLDSCNCEEMLDVHMMEQLQDVTNKLIENGTFTEEDFIGGESVSCKEENSEQNGFSALQQNTTIEIMADYIEKLENEIDRLVGVIEECNKDKVYIEELRAREAALKKAMVDIRIFNDDQREEREERESRKFDESLVGHNLLAGRRKILVLGDSQINQTDMLGIATKVFGFEKKDFEFFTDYDKITNAAGRLQQADKYAAVILGAMPHKVSRLGCWNSICSKFATEGFGPIAVEAHNNSGYLVITKESYKKALTEVMEQLAA